MQEIARTLAGFKGLRGLFGPRSNPGEYDLLPSPDAFEWYEREIEALSRKIEVLEKDKRQLKNEVIKEQKRLLSQQERAKDEERKSLMKMLRPAFADFSRMHDYILSLPPEKRKEELQVPWVNGVYLALSNMVQALAAAGMKRFSVKAGTPFDSEWHNPVTYEYSEKFANGIVLRTLEYGYYLRISQGDEPGDEEEKRALEKRVLLYPAQVVLSLGRR